MFSTRLGWVGLVYSLPYVKINIIYLYPTPLKYSMFYLNNQGRVNYNTRKKTTFEKQVLIKKNFNIKECLIMIRS